MHALVTTGWQYRRAPPCQGETVSLCEATYMQRHCPASSPLAMSSPRSMKGKESLSGVCSYDLVLRTFCCLLWDSVFSWLSLPVCWFLSGLTSKGYKHNDDKAPEMLFTTPRQSEGNDLSGERRGIDYVDCKNCSTPVIRALDCSLSTDIRTISNSNANSVFQWLCIQRNVTEGCSQGRWHLQQQFLHKTKKGISKSWPSLPVCGWFVKTTGCQMPNPKWNTSGLKSLQAQEHFLIQHCSYESLGSLDPDPIWCREDLKNIKCTNRIFIAFIAFMVFMGAIAKQVGANRRNFDRG